jgi:ABC-type nitrate/sulfonate/bicarbonate transport system permease component
MTTTGDRGGDRSALHDPATGRETQLAAELHADRVSLPSRRGWQLLRRSVPWLLGSRLLGWLALAVVVAYWQAKEARGLSATVPPPAKVFARIWQLLRHGSLLDNVGVTLHEALLGYAIAIVVGVTIGLAMSRVKLVYALLEPAVELLRPTPISALVPLLILFLGIGTELRVGAVALGAFFPIVVNTFAGGRAMPKAARETGLTFGLSGPRLAWELAARYAQPAIFVGLRLGLAVSLLVAVLSEMISGSTGLGYMIINAQQTLTVVDLYAYLIALAIMGYALNVLFLLIERRVLFWDEAYRHSS